MTKSQEFPSGLFTVNSFFLITNGIASAQAIIYNKYTHILKKKKKWLHSVMVYTFIRKGIR